MFPDPAGLRQQAAAMRTMIAAQTREEYDNYVTTSGMLQSIVGDKGIAEVTD